MNKVLETVLMLTDEEYPKNIPNLTTIFKAKDIWEACLQSSEEKESSSHFPLAPQIIAKHAILEKSLIDNGWISEFRMELMISRNKNNEPEVFVYHGNHRLTIMYVNNLNYEVDTTLRYSDYNGIPGWGIVPSEKWKIK